MTLANRLPTGPGSRGGRWHDPEYRRAYHRAWRAAHPEYREREALRLARKRSGDDARPFPRPLPDPAESCACPCGCGETVVVVCGFCRDGMHGEDSA